VDLGGTLKFHGEVPFQLKFIDKTNPCVTLPNQDPPNYDFSCTIRSNATGAYRYTLQPSAEKKPLASGENAAVHLCIPDNCPHCGGRSGLVEFLQLKIRWIDQLLNFVSGKKNTQSDDSSADYTLYISCQNQNVLLADLSGSLTVLNVTKKQTVKWQTTGDVTDNWNIKLSNGDCNETGTLGEGQQSDTCKVNQTFTYDITNVTDGTGATCSSTGNFFKIIAQ
jgi:hypothetical protein